jgi:hypothetical protein
VVSSVGGSEWRVKKERRMRFGLERRGRSEEREELGKREKGMK